MCSLNPKVGLIPRETNGVILARENPIHSNVTLSVDTVDHCRSDSSWILAQPYCFPFLLHVGFEVVLGAFWMVWGGSGAEGTERICAYHTSLSSYWQESACSSVGERTCIQRGEERRSERNSGRMIGGGEGEKKLMPARHPIWGRFLVVEPKRFHCSKHCFISLFVCVCMYMCNAFMQGWFIIFSASG